MSRSSFHAVLLLRGDAEALPEEHTAMSRQVREEETHAEQVKVKLASARRALKRREVKLSQSLPDEDPSARWARLILAKNGDDTWKHLYARVRDCERAADKVRVKLDGCPGYCAR